MGTTLCRMNPAKAVPNFHPLALALRQLDSMFFVLPIAPELPLFDPLEYVLLYIRSELLRLGLGAR